MSCVGDVPCSIVEREDRAKGPKHVSFKTEFHPSQHTLVSLSGPRKQGAQYITLIRKHSNAGLHMLQTVLMLLMLPQTCRRPCMSTSLIIPLADS